MNDKFFTIRTLESIDGLDKLGLLMEKEIKKSGEGYFTGLFIRELCRVANIIRKEIDAVKSSNRAYLKRYSKLLSNAKTNKGNRRPRHPVPQYPANG